MEQFNPLRLKEYSLFGFFLLCLTIINLSSCKKYEDGPALSFRSANARIEGNWIAESYIVNGLDSIPLNKDCGCHLNFSRHSTTNIFTKDGYRVESNDCHLSGKWEWSENKKEITIAGFIIDLGNRPLFTENTWTVRRLTKKEFWIEIDYKGNNFFLKYKRGV